MKAIAQARDAQLDRQWLTRWLTPEEATVAGKLATIEDAELVRWRSMRSFQGLV